MRLFDDEDSACPALLEREFHSLHRNVPGLRRAGVDTNTIRQVSADCGMGVCVRRLHCTEPRDTARRWVWNV